jgi:hypothetical protein
MEYQQNLEKIEIPVDDVILKFKQDFQRIKQMGWVPSHRLHNTGIGKTFEDVIGVKENNSQSVDYMNFLELKSQREYTGSMITLFTKSPDIPTNANTVLRETFGIPDEDSPEMKVLHTTISGAKFNTLKDRFGFKLEVDENKQRIYIQVKKIEDNSLVSDKIFYNFKTLREIVEQKCKNIAYISAETKIQEGREYFRYNSAVLLTGLTFKKFINSVKQGLILYDIRIGVYKTGKSLGKTHDHGSGFRIKKANVGTVFKITQI